MSCVVKRLRRFSWLLLSSSVALMALSAVAHAQTFTINNLTKNSASKASYPNMVVDKDGNLNLVWVDSVNGIMFSRSSTSATGTATLGTAVNVPGSKGQALPAFQPQIAVNPNNPQVIAITWAALDPASPAGGPPTYDVYASWSNNGAVLFNTKLISTASPGGLPLADSPRLAFDSLSRVNIVWGQFAVWISQTPDGLSYTTPAPLATQPVNTGGPRVAVDASGEVVVAWTDTANAGAQGTYCTQNPSDAATVGGYVWVNETLPPAVAGAAYTFTSSNTRNLSTTDWFGTDPIGRFRNGFYGCSSDNLVLFTDHAGHVHLLWSDESPVEDVLTSKPINGDAITKFSFPINLASTSAASPNVAVDGNGSFYVVWSGGPTGGTGASSGSTNSQGIFFTRSDDGGDSFQPSPGSPAINIASPNAVAPAYPRVAVDSKGDVNVVWEQVDQPQPISATDTFNAFFARSTDKGVTFPTVAQVSTNSSALCIPATPVQTTPNNTTCGTVQIGVDSSSTPDMAWVNQASGAAVADIDFATTTLQPPPSDFSISSTQPSQTVQPGQTANFTLNATATGGFSGSIALGCSNFFSTTQAPGQQPQTSELTTLKCSASPASISGGQSSTVSVVVPSGILSNNATFAQLTFTIAGTSTAAPQTTHEISVTVDVGNNVPGSVTPTSASLSAATPSANFTVSVNPASFAGSTTLTFSCLNADSGAPLPSWLSCTFNPHQLNPAQSTQTTLTLKEIGTPTASVLISPPSLYGMPQFGPEFGIAAAWTMALAALAMMLIMFTLGRRQRLSAAILLRGVLVMTLTIVLAAGLVSCGGSTSTPTTATGTTGGSGGSGGSGGGGGTGGGTGNPVQMRVSVLAQSSTNTKPVSLGTVTITAQ